MWRCRVRRALPELRLRVAKSSQAKGWQVRQENGSQAKGLEVKAKLQLSKHRILESENTIEVHYDGKLLCIIYGADGPGIRIISKHIVDGSEFSWGLVSQNPGVVEVMIR